ncbi:Putative O-antigen transporter [Serratia entomophila]|uniref:Oligosaccharide flippase family protein n=1 Tax=Serratia entomophila TaxID=42906 RepID=A0ABY5CXA3_9GAMM|nr:oligosaccharide flippase family protein [Serratia entomophila]UIW19913.1 oligosaccharide flippase family protein [Serratia entomophila]USV02433.1 oligosaccharide flippase family protein [Serratia entomophila]CAI0773726.1 Putative O-antigen transporter [Serratia entomophila]CAI0778190.1 Putative O-antigen transporter [Serratia entomophila]CAI0782100.1 Putative O-antigen transporter [Serratia entomophila]
MSRVATNTFWLMLAQIGGLFIPLIELPVLARALGQQGYGQVLYALGIALTASVFVEFGFNFSAARSVVKVRENKRELAQLVTNVLFAKLLLSLAVAGVVGILVFSGTGATAIPHHWFIWISLFILAFGFTPLWYYVGIERLILPALLDLGLRSTGLMFTILLVSSPQHAQRVLTIQATVGIINTLLPTLLMIRTTGLGGVSLRGAITALRESWELFLYKGAQSIMGSIASTLLGLLGGARAVGAFVPAEKLVRAASGLAAPVLNAAFPHLVRLQSDSAHAAKRVVSLAVGVLFLATVVFAVLTVCVAGWVVNIVFGPGYQDAIELLRLLVWIVPLRICSMALAILWFIPGGKEQVASRVMMLNIVIICLLAFLLVPTLGGLGMTIAFLAAEVTMFSLLLFLFCRKPFKAER